MTDFKANMHQIRFRLRLRPRPRWGSLQRSPRPPSWIWGPLRGRGRGWAGEEEGKGREGKWRGGKGRAPKVLLNQGPSEPCYATGSVSIWSCWHHIKYPWCRLQSASLTLRANSVWEESRQQTGDERSSRRYLQFCVLLTADDHSGKSGRCQPTLRKRWHRTSVHRMPSGLLQLAPIWHWWSNPAHFQSVQNAAACLLSETRFWDHITPVLQQVGLHIH